MPSPLKKFAIGGNVALSLALAFAALVAVNIVAARHPRTWDWTGTGEFTLSDKTKNILKNLPGDKADKVEKVEIAVFTGDRDDLGRRVVNLLKCYETDSKGRVVLHRPQTEQDLVTLQRQGFKIPKPGSDTLLAVKYQKQQEAISQSRLAQMTYDQRGGPPRVGTFTGESAITFAIKTVTEDLKTRAVFVVGHGELSSKSAELSAFQKALTEERIDLSEVNLLEGDLTGADLVIVCAPNAPFSPEETAKLDTYLRQGGRGLFFLEPFPTSERKGLVATNLEPALLEWGIQVGSEMVFDLASPSGEPAVHLYRGGVLLPPTGSPNDPFPTGLSPSHPITESLHTFTPIGPILPSNLAFYTVRAVRPKDAKSQEVVKLIESPPNSAAFFDLTPESLQQGLKTPQGPIPTAVALEKTDKAEGESAATRKTRLVVFGDVSFIEDNLVKQMPFNKDLSLNAVNWLLEKEDSLGIGPKSGSELLSMNLATPGARDWVSYTCFLILPGGALVLGLFVWRVRKR